MTTQFAGTQTETNQILIDARLDAIERILLGRLPRADRVAIVQEVESQIQELLGDRDPREVGREDILAVLRKLDPPEAYLIDADGIVSANRSNPTPRRLSQFSEPRHQEYRLPERGNQGIIGGILGICSMVAPFLFLIFLLMVGEGLGEEGRILVYLVIPMGMALGITALILSILGRRQGTLPIIGMVTSSISLPVWLIFFVL